MATDKAKTIFLVHLFLFPKPMFFSFLEDKIEKSSGAEKVALINDLMKLWEERGVHFASKTPQGEYAANACQLMYDNKELLKKTDF